MSDKDTQRVEAVGQNPPKPTHPVVAAVSDLLDEQLADQRQEIAEAIGALRKPIRPPVLPSPQDQQQQNATQTPDQRFGRFGFGEVSDMRDMLYRSLSPTVRKIRNPRSDAAMASWLRAKRYNDLGSAERISRELNADFDRASGERATYLYGTPDATSGIGNGTDGPEIVPLPLANLIVLARNLEAVGRSIFQRFTSNANTLRIPTSATATAAMVAEGATAAQGEPALASVLLSKKKAQCFFRVSDEIMADSAFNLISFFSERAGSAIGALEDVQFATSNGTPPNVTAAMITGVTDVAEAVSTDLTYVDLVKLFYTLPKQYLRDSVWVADQVALQMISSLVSTTGMPIMTPGVTLATVTEDTVPGQAGTIFGRPVVGMPLASGSIWIGSPRIAYGYLDGGPLTVRASEHSRWATDEVEWKITERFDGAVLVANAARKMIGLTP